MRINLSERGRGFHPLFPTTSNTNIHRIDMHTARLVFMYIYTQSMLLLRITLRTLITARVTIPVARTLSHSLNSDV